VVPTTWLSFGVSQDNVELDACKHDIDAGKFQPETDDELDPWKCLNEVWLNPPLSGYLHIFVCLSDGE